MTPEITSSLPLIALAVAVLAICFLGYRLIQVGREKEREREERARMAALATELKDAQTGLAARLEAATSATAVQQSEMQRTLNERLDQFSKRLGDSLSEQTEKTGKTMTALQERLAVIDRAQSNITELSTQMVSLQDILSNKQARGAFGEIQLYDLVTATLPPSAYSFQATLSNGRRADCLIRLPNPPGPIVVDAKFPLESYQAIRAAEDDASRLAAQRAFVAALQKHISDIAERYIVPGETADSALLFLPSEAIYAEIHSQFQQVLDRSYKARVWIVAPTTMMATLNTIRAVLKDSRMREQAGVIQKQVAMLLDDIGRLDQRVDNLKRHFQQAEKDIREIETSSDKIGRRAGRIEELQIEDGSTAESLEGPPEGTPVGSLAGDS